MKLIPEDHLFKPDSQVAGEIERLVLEAVKAEKIWCRVTGYPEFVDCGGNLEEIRCPVCGRRLDFDWWTGCMDGAYEENRFEDLTVRVPCCGGETNLNELDYRMDCGFSCFAVYLLNPEGQLPEGFLEGLRERTGMGFRAIYARI